jgi:magnesium-transporting ATPase (P-type)
MKMRDFDMHERGRGRRFYGHRMMKPLVMGVVLVAVLTLLVMSLWNALLPAIVGVKSIGFWQALGVLVLCRILFGGLGFRPGMFGMALAHRRMHERWMQMTPEQRDAFIRERRDGFGRHGHRGHCGGRGRRDEQAETRPQPEDNSTKAADTE